MGNAAGEEVIYIQKDVGVIVGKDDCALNILVNTFLNTLDRDTLKAFLLVYLRISHFFKSHLPQD